MSHFRFIFIEIMRYTPLKLFSWTPAPSSLHQTNYKQIIYSSVDPDQMAFGIQKEINLGYTRLNCDHYYRSVFIVKIKLSYNNKRLVTPVVTQVKNGGNVQ